MSYVLSTQSLQDQITREYYQQNPAEWVKVKFDEHLWSKQRQIIESVRDNRRTAVHSCHASGKSYLTARIALWWLFTHAPGEAFVVTSASSFKQVRAILWRELGRAHAKGKLPGRTNQTELWIPTAHGKDELVAAGWKPDDDDPTAFQGIHSRHVLVLFDESCGIGKLLWDAADTLISNEGSRIVVVGNPDDPVTEFYEVCKPGSGWNVIGISAFDTPNFTGEPVSDLVKASLVSETWVREKKRKWGESNPLYISKVLGEFPEIGEDGLIPLKWIRQAQDRDLPMDLPIELGVDVGGGGDKNIFCLRRGGHARIIRRDTQPDTMVTTGNVVRAIREHRPSRVKVDYIGIGRGAVDRLNEMGHNVEGVNVGEQAIDKDSYINLRAEGYWHLREIFQSGEIDIDSEDEDLAAQLAELQYKPTSGGKIQIESKLEMKRRLGHSPDDADALMLAFFEKKYKYTEATW